jgi:predicted SnoaL-like aldol condensation-catalyzing enzyme
MKKIYLPVAAVLAFAITACNNSGTSSTMKGSMDSSATSTEQQNLEKNRSVYKAIESGDSATIRSLIADDAVDHQGPAGQELKGGDNIVRMLSDMHNHVKGLSFDVVTDAASGDYVFSMVNVKGTATDNTMGMPAGSSMDSKQVDVIKVKDGKMVEHWGFLDWQDVMKMGQQPMMDSTGKMKK